MPVAGGRGWSGKPGFKNQKCFLWLNLKLINLKLIRKMFLPLKCMAVLNTYTFLFILVLKESRHSSLKRCLANRLGWAGWGDACQFRTSLVCCSSAPSHGQWGCRRMKKRRITHLVGNLYWQNIHVLAKAVCSTFTEGRDPRFGAREEISNQLSQPGWQAKVC